MLVQNLKDLCVSYVPYVVKIKKVELTLFFGRFHPLLVHLPIGFLMLAVIIEITERFGWTKGLKVAVPFALLLGTLSGVAVSVLGLMLATSGDYDEATLSYHKWAGIVTTLVAFGAYAISKDWLNSQLLKEKGYAFLLFLIIIGLSVTGHLGGNMTHGETYLTEYMPFKSETKDVLARAKVTDLAKVQLFGDIVHPIIKAKCMSCHNASKQKGKLSFASIESYQKGGKSGNTIIAGDALESELLVRVNLDENHKEFMPTDGKTPLTDEEKTLITYWIANANADHDTLFLATKPDEKTVELAMNYLQLNGSVEPLNFNGSTTVNHSELEKLTEMGFTIRELIAGSNVFEVVLPPNKSDNVGEQLKALSSIKNNIFWLTLENVGLQNADLQIIGTFEQLQILKLAKNKIDNVSAFANLDKLESINLYQTNIDKNSIKQLSQLPKLQRIYIWQTKINNTEINNLQAEFPKVELIGGM